MTKTLQLGNFNLKEIAEKCVSSDKRKIAMLMRNYFQQVTFFSLNDHKDSHTDYKTKAKPNKLSQCQSVVFLVKTSYSKTLLVPLPQFLFRNLSKLCEHDNVSGMPAVFQV